MRTRIGAVAGLVTSALGASALLLITAGCSRPSAEPQADASQIIALEHEMWDAWKGGRHDDMAAQMTPNVVLVDDDAGIIDRNEFLTAMKGSGCAAESYSMENPIVSMVAPTVAVIAYQVSGVQTCAGERRTGAPQLATSVWVKKGDAWLTAAHHQSALKAKATTP
jgi:hypothetical protein